VDFDIREDDRLASGIDHFFGFSKGSAKGPGITALVDLGCFVMRDAGNVDEVAGELDVNGPFEAERGVENAVNFLERRLGIAEDSGSDGELFEDFLLGIELADFVMEERIFLTFFHAGRAADDDDGRFFGKRFGGGISDFETADAISDTDRPEAADAGIGISSETSALFIAGVYGPEPAFCEQVVKTEDIIAGNTEDVTDTVGVKLGDEILADGRRRLHKPVFSIQFSVFSKGIS
jgi:hypothetical protein